MLDELPPAYKWRELVNQAMNMLLAGGIIPVLLIQDWAFSGAQALAFSFPEHLTVSDLLCKNQKLPLSTTERVSVGYSLRIRAILTKMTLLLLALCRAVFLHACTEELSVSLKSPHFVRSFENQNPSEIKGTHENFLFCYPMLYPTFERHTRQRRNKQQVGLISQQQLSFSPLFHPSGDECWGSRCSLSPSLIFLLLSMLLLVSQLIQFTYLKEMESQQNGFSLGFIRSSPEPKLGLVAMVFSFSPSLLFFLFFFLFSSSWLSSIVVANLQDGSFWGSHLVSLLSLDLMWPSIQHQGMLERSQERSGSGWEVVGQVGAAEAWRRWLWRAD